MLLSGESGQAQNCTWFDAGTSSLEFSFTSDYSNNYPGVSMNAACVSISDQFSNRFDWNERESASIGVCPDCELYELFKDRIG